MLGEMEILWSISNQTIMKFLPDAEVGAALASQKPKSGLCQLEHLWPEAKKWRKIRSFKEHLKNTLQEMGELFIKNHMF